MSLPTFTTTIRDIDTQVEAEILFNDFTSAFTKQDLYDAAEWYAKNRAPNGSIYSFRHLDGGLMRMVCGLIVMGVTNSQISKAGVWLDDAIQEHYGFTVESIPPRMIVREAVAIRVRYGSVLADLERELSGKPHGAVVREIGNAARKLASPDDAYLLTDVEVDRIIRGM